MINKEIILIIIVIVLSISLIIQLYDRITDKAIILRQQNTIRLLEGHLRSSSNHIGDLNSQLDELKAELHTIKFPATEFIHFSVLCKQNNVQWYKDKVKEIFDYFTKDISNEEIHDFITGNLIWFNQGYLHSNGDRINYYIKPINRSEFISTIDEIENKYNISILDVIKE